jgi:recombination protein RecR
MDLLDQLTESFKRFPGIGSRQARRFAYFLLNSSLGFRQALAHNINTLSSEIMQCDACFRFFRKENGAVTCPICTDAARDHTRLLVVEKDMDFENIHAMGVFDGRYFVLGGSLPVLAEDPARLIRIRELVARVEKGTQEGLKEIILAFSVNVEGENTAQYVRKTLEPMCEQYSIRISTLGKGLSTGTELEYSDDDTFRSALENRR